MKSQTQMIVMITLVIGSVTGSAVAQVVYPVQAQSEALTELPAQTVNNADEPLVEIEADPVVAAPATTEVTQPQEAKGAVGAAKSPTINIQNTVSSNPTTSTGTRQDATQAASQSNAQNTNQDTSAATGAALGTTANSLSEGNAARSLRLRKESDTEEYLQRRLEEGRMRDEMSRAESLSGVQMSVSERAKAEADAKQAIIAAQPVAPAAPQIIINNAPEKTEESAQFWEKVSIGPSAGYTWYDEDSVSRAWGIRNRVTLGLLLTAPVTDHFAIEGKFDWARYEYDYATSYVDPYSAYSPYGGYGGAYSSIGFKKDQYAMGANARLNVLSGRVKPFIVGGLSYILNQATIQSPGYYTFSGASSTRSDHYVGGNLGAGLDVGITKNVALGARFEWVTFVGQDSSYYVYYLDRITPLVNDASDMYRVLGTVQVSF